MTDEWDWEDDSEELTAEEIADMDRRIAELDEFVKERSMSPEVQARAQVFNKIDKLQGQYSALFGEEAYLGLLGCDCDHWIELLKRSIREGKPVQYPRREALEP